MQYVTSLVVTPAPTEGGWWDGNHEVITCRTLTSAVPEPRPLLFESRRPTPVGLLGFWRRVTL